MKRTAFTCGLAAIAAAALLSACGGQSVTSGQGKGKDGSLNVVATTTQTCDYIQQLTRAEGIGLSFKRAGKHHERSANGKETAHVNLTCLLAPNASAHKHEMTVDETKALAQADLFVVSGVDLEHFLDKAVEASGFSGTMVVSTGVLSAKDTEQPKNTQDSEAKLPYRIERGKEQVNLESWPFKPSSGEAPEFRFDPHVWTSPRGARVQVANIADALEEALPDQAAALQKTAKQYEGAIDELIRWSQQSLDSVPAEHRVLFTSHDAFGYLSRDFHIKFIGSALSDFNEQQDATADHIAKEAQAVRESGARALFAENSNNSKSIEAIARAAGVKAIIGDDTLYGDSLGLLDAPTGTYLGATIHNIRTLVTAWNGKVQPLPQQLKDALQEETGSTETP